MEAASQVDTQLEYRKRSKNVKGSIKRPSFGRRSGGRASFASQQLVRTVSRIAKRQALRSVENKYSTFETVPSLVQLETTSLTPFIEPTAIAQGDTDTSRDGDQLYINAIRGRYVIGIDPSIAPVQSGKQYFVRFLAVQGSQNIGTTVGGVLQAPSSGWWVTSPADYDQQRGNRLTVLQDKLIPFTQNSMADSIATMLPGVATIDVNIPGSALRQRKISYIAGTTTCSDPVRFFVMMKEYPTTGNEVGIFIQGTVRTTFKDI